MRLPLFLCASILFGATSCQGLLPQSSERVFRNVAESVFVVKVLGCEGVLRFGSAVAVLPDLVVTNKHVAGINIGQLLVVSHGSRTWIGYLAYVSSVTDLCAIRVPGLEARPIQLRDSGSVKVGEHVFAVGSPKGLELSLSEGLISGVRQLGGGAASLIQTTAAISPGSSGGGLFDSRSRLVGITTSAMRDAENLGFALAASEVKRVIGALGLEPVQEFERASILLGLGQYDESRRALEKALAMDQTLEGAAFALGEASIMAPEKEVEYYRTVVRVDPSQAEAWAALASTYSRLHAEVKDRDQRQLINRYLAGEEVDGSSLDKESTQSLLYLSEELEARRTACRLNPDDTHLTINLASTYCELGSLEEAGSLSRGVLAADPSNPLALVVLAQVYTKQGRRDLADVVYRKLTDGAASTLDELDAQQSAWLALGSSAALRRDSAASAACRERFKQLSSEQSARYRKCRELFAARREAQADAARPYLLKRQAGR